jgi:hypothetical protein
MESPETSYTQTRPDPSATETCRVLYFVDQLDVDNVRLGFNAWRRIWGLH